MIRILKYSFIVLVLIPTTSIFAQKKWTLEECITYALQNNIQLKREVLQSERFKKERLAAFANFTPSLGGQFSHKFQEGSVFNSLTGKFSNKQSQIGSGGIGGSLNLFQGLYNWNYLAQTKFDLLASIESVEELKRSISINVAAKYLEVLYAKENLILAKGRLEVSEKQVVSLEKQYELGKSSNAEYLQIKSQAIAEKVQLTNAQNTLDMASLELAQMLELPEVGGFEVYTDNIIIPTDTLQVELKQYYDDAILNTPSLKRANYNLKSAEKRYLIALGAALPSISLEYQMGSFYTDQGELTNSSGIVLSKYPDYSYKEQLKDNISKSIAIQINIPIYGRLQNYVRISKAKIDKIDAQYAVDEAEKGLKKTIQQAYADVKGSYSSFQSMSESAASYNEVYETSKEKFNLGMINAVDYGIARNNLIKAQGDLLHAKYSYLFKLKILDFYRGVPITL